MAEQQERHEELLPSQISMWDQRLPILLMFTLLSLLGIAFLMSSSSNFVILHQVPLGHVGAYWRGGTLMTTFTYPGFHLMLPMITKFKPIDVMSKTDAVKDVTCTTKDGTNITFDKIEVVNRLSKEHVYEILHEYGAHYDKTLIRDIIRPKIEELCSFYSLEQLYLNKLGFIAEEMRVAIRTDCSRYAPGIEILSVGVSQANVPENIKRTYNNLLIEKLVKAVIEAEMQKITEAQTNIKLQMQLLAEDNCTMGHEYVTWQNAEEI